MTDFLLALALVIAACVGVVAYILMKADPVNADGIKLCEKDYTYIEDFDICAANDYYKQDGIRMPLGMSAVKQVLRKEEARLPTRAEVDAIWKAADIKLQPRPLDRYDIMTTMSEFIRHNTIIENQLKDLDTEDKLIAGHKKDIIQQRQDGRVTIYGWHYFNGSPIQYPTSVHGYNYRDYSHGLRLIKTPRH